MQEQCRLQGDESVMPDFGASMANEALIAAMPQPPVMAL